MLGYPLDCGLPVRHSQDGFRETLALNWDIGNGRIDFVNVLGCQLEDSMQLQNDQVSIPARRLRELLKRFPSTIRAPSLLLAYLPTGMPAPTPTQPGPHARRQLYGDDLVAAKCRSLDHRNRADATKCHLATGDESGVFSGAEKPILVVNAGVPLKGGSHQQSPALFCDAGGFPCASSGMHHLH